MRNWIDRTLTRLLAEILKWPYLAYVSTVRLAKEERDALLKVFSSPEGKIYVLWHSKTFLLISIARRCRIVSLHMPNWRNRFLGALLRSFGFETIMVSHQASATRELMRAIKSGKSVVLAVDGPYGPRGMVKPGAVYLAQKTSLPLVALRVDYKRSFRIKQRWDCYEVPLPFTETHISVSEPLAAKGRSRETIQHDLKEWLGGH